MLVAFSRIAPLASLPYLNHELGRNSGHWAEDIYYLGSLILCGQIYWLLLPVIGAIIIKGARPLLLKAGYAVIFMGMFNFALFIIMVSLGPLVFDFMRDAKLLFFAMLCISL